MRNLSKAGCIFYGIAMIEMGLQTIFWQSFPYFLLPPLDPCKTAVLILILIGGIAFVLTGACLAFGKKARQAALLFGGLLLAIFCFYYIPYELLMSHKFMSMGEWENAEKELALAGGALAIAGCFPAADTGPFIGFLAKLVPSGAILYAITIICFSMLHFLHAKEASGYIPSWIPAHLFWMYFCGVALLGSGISIIFKINPGLFATLLGAMIFTWFIILHVSRVILAVPSERADEITSAFLALAYSGIAFVIAGNADRTKG